MKLFQRKPMFVTTGYENPPTAPLPLFGLASRLGGMSPRERQLILGTAALVFLAILWWIALAPAINTLAKAPEQVRVLESELSLMRQQTNEVEMLRQQPVRTPPQDFAGTVQTRVKASLGEAAKISGTPAQVTLTLTNANPALLLSALQDVSEAAQAKVESLSVTKNADGTVRAEVKWVPRGNN